MLKKVSKLLDAGFEDVLPCRTGPRNILCVCMASGSLGLSMLEGFAIFIPKTL